MAVTTSKLPVLESGDRLSRAEFHQRYCQRPDLKKAELVEGVVYVASPVRRPQHGRPHSQMVGWVVTYAAKTPGVDYADNATVLLDPDNELQPDVMLWREAPDGPRLNDQGYLEGAPQLVIEVAASSASYDLHDKLRAYERNRVQEYIVWRVLNQRIDWFRWQEGRFVPVEPDPNGVIESTAFPGLRLHVAKMLAGDLAGVLAELER
jgi:Uma2 family endonuclease